MSSLDLISSHNLEHIRHVHLYLESQRTRDLPQYVCEKAHSFTGSTK